MSKQDTCECGASLMESLRILSQIASNPNHQNSSQRRDGMVNYIDAKFLLMPPTYSLAEMVAAGEEHRTKEYYLGDCSTGITNELIDSLKDSNDEEEINRAMTSVISSMIMAAQNQISKCSL